MQDYLVRNRTLIVYDIGDPGIPSDAVRVYLDGVVRAYVQRIPLSEKHPAPAMDAVSMTEAALRHLPGSGRHATTALTVGTGEIAGINIATARSRKETPCSP